MQADIRTGRLSEAEIESNFCDMHAPLKRAEALVEADRCYFCFDAPCATACPTGIDIPAFIQKIRSDNPRGSARTILQENIMGGMCARVCPTEILCEQVCVRSSHEHNPVSIGLLQRYATDIVIDGDLKLFERAPVSGNTVAVVGGGPAGLSCAHRLATLGHSAVVFNRDAKPGGLNEYGIAAYKTSNKFAQREVNWILGIGGIEVKANVSLGADFSLDELREQFDAVFLAFGLTGTNELELGTENSDTVLNAVEYIADLRQSDHRTDLPVGRRVVVIGGGMTAIDIAVQSKRLGAERVDIVYRRGPDEMGASEFEQELAQTSGVMIHYWSAPAKINPVGGGTTIDFDRTALDEQGKLSLTGDKWTVEADIIFKAVGQSIGNDVLGEISSAMEMTNGRLKVNEDRQTSLPNVWAGGDCVYGRDDLTVSAVQDGKVAAHAIHGYLQSREDGNG